MVGIYFSGTGNTRFCVERFLACYEGMYFYNKTKKYSDKLHIDREQCIGCGICVSVCPMENISLQSKKARQQGRCTMCYRCVNHCPKQAITLLGKKLYEQCSIEKYI